MKIELECVACNRFVGTLEIGDEDAQLVPPHDCFCNICCRYDTNGEVSHLSRYAIRHGVNRRGELCDRLTTDLRNLLQRYGHNEVVTIKTGKGGHPYMVDANNTAHTHCALLRRCTLLEINFISKYTFEMGQPAFMLDLWDLQILTQLQALQIPLQLQQQLQQLGNIQYSASFLMWMFLMKILECGKFNQEYVRLVLMEYALPEFQNYIDHFWVPANQRIQFCNVIGGILSKNLKRKVQLQGNVGNQLVPGTPN